MQLLTRDRISYVFDRRLPPVLRVAPGETFVVETEDSRTGRTRTPETTRPEFLKAMRACGYHGNPVTGPIEVAGAEPGDTLAVHIQSMKCDTLGYTGYWPFLYHLDDWLTDPGTELVEIRDGTLHFDFRTASGSHPLQVPVRPMIGAIGTAPALEALSSGNQGRHGGNLDVPEIGPGCTLYLPVAVPGALLFLGDCPRLPGRRRGERHRDALGGDAVDFCAQELDPNHGLAAGGDADAPGQRGLRSATGVGPVAGNPRDDPVAGGALRLDQGGGPAVPQPGERPAPGTGAGGSLFDALAGSKGTSTCNR